MNDIQQVPVNDSQPARQEAGQAPAERAVATASRVDSERSKTDERVERDRQKEEEKRQKEQDKRKKARGDGDKDLLQWTRTSMSLLTTGIGAERALAYLNATDTGRRLDPFDVLHTLALCLVGVGLVALVLACVQRWRLAQSLKHGDPIPEPFVSLSLLVAVSIVAIFVVALVTVLSFRDAIKATSSLPASGQTLVVLVPQPLTAWQSA